MIRSIAGFSVFALVIVAGCALGPNASEISQDLCIEENQQSASCPDSAWRIPYTASQQTAAEQSAGLPTPAPSVRCSGIAGGGRRCIAFDWVSVNSYVETVCEFDSQGTPSCGSTYCVPGELGGSTCTGIYP